MHRIMDRERIGAIKFIFNIFVDKKQVPTLTSP
jgi:hypothetical protein